MDNSLCFLIEACNVVPNNEIVIMENHTKTESGVPKLFFEARLQDTKPNQNGRFYSSSICNEIVTILTPKAQSRSLFQEIDHPTPTGDAETAKRRAVTVELKNCGSLIRNLKFENGEIIGQMETLSGFYGPDMYNTIVHDKADIGFSLRMFGKVKPQQMTGLNEIVQPIRPITYDTVSNPSHKNAKVMTFLPENINQFVTSDSRNMQMLTESACTFDKLELRDLNECVYDYVNNLIKESFLNIGPIEWLF